MIDLSILNKQELIIELSRVLEMEAQLQAKIDAQKNYREELNIRRNREINKLKKLDMRAKGLTRADNITQIINVIQFSLMFLFPALTLYVMFKFDDVNIMGYYIFSDPWDAMRAIGILLVLSLLSWTLFLWITIGLSNFIYYCHNEEWDKFDKTELPKLMENVPEIIELDKEIAKVDEKIDIIKKGFPDIKKMNNLAPKYHGYESTLIDYLKTNRADNLKEALQILEEEWRHSEVKKQLHQQNQKQLQQQQLTQQQINYQNQQLENIHHELQQQRQENRIYNS